MLFAMPLAQLTANAAKAADTAAAWNAAHGGTRAAFAAISAWANQTCDTLEQAYITQDPLVTGILLTLFFATYCWAASLVTRNYSWTDRLWSITPAVYAIHFGFYQTTVAILNDKQTIKDTLVALVLWLLGSTPNPNVVLPSTRLFFAALLPTLWGARLTYNFVRKGGYERGSEDYRWAVVRTWFSPAVYQLFNIVFIALYQHVLIFLIITPASVALKAELATAGLPRMLPLDYLTVALFLVTLAFETVADQQQWEYQTEKYRLLGLVNGDTSKLPAEYARGFLTSGLFAYSRHPNFFAELSLWWIYYLFSVSTTGVWLNWSIIGTVLLTLLFQGSTWMTEALTAKKYPSYGQYQKSTSRIIPWFPAQATNQTKSRATSATKAAPAQALPVKAAAPTSPAPKAPAATQVAEPDAVATPAKSPKATTRRPAATPRSSRKAAAA